MIRFARTTHESCSRMRAQGAEKRLFEVKSSPFSQMLSRHCHRSLISRGLWCCALDIFLAKRKHEKNYLDVLRKKTSTDMSFNSCEPNEKRSSGKRWVFHLSSTLFPSPTVAFASFSSFSALMNARRSKIISWQSWWWFDGDRRSERDIIWVWKCFEDAAKGKHTKLPG